MAGRRHSETKTMRRFRERAEQAEQKIAAVKADFDLAVDATADGNRSAWARHRIRELLGLPLPMHGAVVRGTPFDEDLSRNEAAAAHDIDVPKR